MGVWAHTMSHLESLGSGSGHTIDLRTKDFLNERQRDGETDESDPK